MRILLLAAAMLFTSMLAAQNNPVEWTFEVQKISENEYEVVATANIQSGWAVYSKDMEAGGPIPTQVNIENHPNIELMGEVVEEGSKKKVYDEMFEMEIVKLSGRTSFRQRLKVSGGQDEISGSIKYMTCCEDSCMPPTDVAFSLPLE